MHPVCYHQCAFSVLLTGPAPAGGQGASAMADLHKGEIPQPAAVPAAAADPLPQATLQPPTEPILEQVDLRLPSTLESVRELEAAAEKMAARTGFDEDEASNIAMVAREAVVNAVKHGNRFAPEKSVHALLQRRASGISICIADQGEGMDPDTLPDPRNPENLLRSSGRGVFLMRAFMDDVTFRRLQPGTEVTLVKHRESEPQA